MVKCDSNGKKGEKAHGNYHSQRAASEWSPVSRRGLWSVPLSFFWEQLASGMGPRLHVHPYDEIFVILEGHATFTLGESTVEVDAGNIVIGPAGVPHKFINSGEEILRTINIHPSPQTIGKWVED
jgi:mannose-6-phosphate isomerase-like protein (cupin superfamily)